MRSVFLTGTARESSLEYLLKNREEIIAVITPRLSDNNHRFEKVIYTAVKFGVPVVPVKKNEVTATLKKIEYDLLISCGFSFVLEREAIENSKYAINSHPTLLPKYRGYRSGPYIIINGETESGVTVHLLTDEMDKGDIIMQSKFNVSPFDTTKSLYFKAREIEGKLLFDSIQLLKTGKINRIKQDETKATTFNILRTPDDSLIDWNKPLKDLYNEIRACDPEDYPAYFFVENQKVCIKLWRPEKSQEKFEL